MRHRTAFSIGATAIATFVFWPTAGLADEYSQGSQSYAAGNFSSAKEHFMKAVLAKPKSWQAHYQLANTFVQLKDSANAKKSYMKCLTCQPPADVKTNCAKALAFIASNPALTPPKAAAYRPSLNQSPNRSSSSTEAASENAQGALEDRRARIMQEAEAEIAKMRAEEEARFKQMEANSNQVFRNADGSRSTGLSEEEEDAFHKEVEAKAAAIRERAKRHAASVR